MAKMSDAGRAAIAAGRRAGIERRRLEREAARAGIALPDNVPLGVVDDAAAGPAAYGQDEGGPFDEPIERPTPYTEPEPNVVPVAFPAEVHTWSNAKPHVCPEPDELIAAYRVVKELEPRCTSSAQLLDVLARRVADRAAGLA